MKLFIVADVHSFYNELMVALNDKGFDINNPSHILVSLGDLFDRGTQSKQVMDFVLSLPEDRTRLVVGNHELLMEQILKAGAPGEWDYNNGTIQTIKDLTGIQDNVYDAIFAMRENKQWREYMNRSAYFWQIENYVFVHGWIPNDLENATRADWQDTTWKNGMQEWANGNYIDNLIIYCGHWHASWGHSHLHNIGSEFGADAIFTPFKDNGIVAMDACTAHSGFVNCEVIDL